MELVNKPPAKICGMCAFFQEQPVGTDLVRRGECHRMPPTCTVLPQPNGQVAQFTAYPQMTDDYQICGCFEPKIIEV